MVRGEPEREARLTLWQRLLLRRLVKAARKRPGEPLSPRDWETYFLFGAQPQSRIGKRALRSLPSSPRCGYCGAPFAGIGRHLVGPLGYRPSRKNPNLCATCVELAPPGGTTMKAGVLFADLRGFTALSEGSTPEQVSALLRRFYACAEDVLFPEALIDKLIGDEVMALYLPAYVRPERPDLELDEGACDVIAPVMLDHARKLLGKVGYGRPDGPFVEVGIGLDFGKAFVGNIGERAVHDFTAVGDVVNTASRLQGEARGGEILISDRLASGINRPLGEPSQLALAGRTEPVAAYRLDATRDVSTTG